MKTEKTPTENGKNIKKYLPYALCLALFALISLAYFNPVLSGKVLEQGDIKQFAGSAQEILQYRAENHGADPYWTNRMFAGMPGYQITSDFDFNLIKYLDSAIRFLPRPADYAFIFFAGFFALMLAMRAGWKKSLLGALMFGLTTYLYIILEAGHNSKAHAIAYLPLVVAAVVMTYRGKYLWGGIAMAFAMGLEIYANHPQMTYYMGLATAIFVIIYFFECYFKGRLRHFFIATGILALGALVGVGMNAGRLWSTWSYQQHTIRGGSELTAEGRQEQKGLDKDYLLMWSYGKGETFNLMIPNLYGGGSQTDLGRGSNIRKAVLDYTGNAMQADQISAAAPTYWGDQPFTSGPAYVGAIVVFLFILGAFIVKGSVKWWLLAATALSFLMAWGSNAMWFADFMIDHFPMYNKFRTPSSALIVSSITMPVLAVLAVREWFRREKTDLTDKRRRLYFNISLLLSAGVCAFLVLLSNSVMSFSGPADEQMFGTYPQILRALKADRHDMLVGDAVRSLFFIAATGALLWFSFKGKINSNVVVFSLCALVVLDMWGVDKRYLDNSNFTSKYTMSDPFRGTTAHTASRMLSGDTSYFRVWNRTVSTMQDASTSFYFNSLGGYHAAKLQRYQELWDYHISKNNMGVVSMLNTKYIIEPPQSGSDAPQIRLNTEAFGPAWVVDSIVFAANANEELAALAALDLRRTAVADVKFKDEASFQAPTKDSSAVYSVRLTSYQPNRLTYATDMASAAPVIFSEIYYPEGWNAYVDGSPARHFRADYTLRAMIVPAGSHTVEFRFEPAEVLWGDRINLACTLLAIAAAAAALYFSIRGRKNPPAVEKTDGKSE